MCEVFLCVFLSVCVWVFLCVCVCVVFWCVCVCVCVVSMTDFIFKITSVLVQFIYLSSVQLNVVLQKAYMWLLGSGQCSVMWSPFRLCSHQMVWVCGVKELNHPKIKLAHDLLIIRHPMWIWLSSFRWIQSELKCSGSSKLYNGSEWCYFSNKAHPSIIKDFAKKCIDLHIRLYSPSGAVWGTFYYELMIFSSLIIKQCPIIIVITKQFINIAINALFLIYAHYY